MSYDRYRREDLQVCFGLNPFGTGQCLTTHIFTKGNVKVMMSQSLWNRAMSYD